MKKSLLVITVMIIVFVTKVNAQTVNFGAQHIISTDVMSARYVYAADLDGDGDQDVLSASSFDNKIAWYANDGSGNFGSQQVISTGIDAANKVVAVDLDNDGDQDIIAYGYGGDKKMVWFENDGNGNFGAEQLIMNDVFSFQIADIDNDGDNDIVTIRNSDDNIIYWLANDGSGNFGTEQTIYTASSYIIFLAVADIDGDNDLDVVTGNCWIPNDGLGNFGTSQAITLNSNHSIKEVADINGDGSNDLLIFDNNEIDAYMYPNNGNGTFGAAQNIIHLNAHYIWWWCRPYIVDFNNDGNADIFLGGYDSGDDDDLLYFQNQGNGSFDSVKSVTTNADSLTSIYVCDVDGDGDLNVLTSSNYETTDFVAWYGASVTASVNNVGVDDNISLYPNPTSGIININAKNIQQVSIYNINGELLFVTNKNTIDLSGYPIGVYVVKTTTKKEVNISKIILK